MNSPALCRRGRLAAPASLVATLLAAAVAPSSLGQAAPTTAASTPTETSDSEVVVLSPFGGSATEDNGLAATSTLAGTRVRTELKDIASSISVVTEQFLSDTGAKKNEDLLVYTTNTEVGGIHGNFSGAGGNATYDERPNLLRPSQNTRVRGLDPADNTRDYFLTEIPWDGYNVGRVDLQRGPNSILFGVGSPAGIINTSINAAAFKNANTIESRIDNHGSFRESGDFNYVAIDNVLAFRVAALDDKTKYKQEPAFNHDRRYFGALRFDPKLFADGSTSIRMNFEDGRVRANRPRDLPPIDRITPWFKPVNPSGTTNFGMGKQTYDPIQQYNQLIQQDSLFKNTFMGRLFAADVAMYYYANESEANALNSLNYGTSAMQAYMNNLIIDSKGNLLGGNINGALIGRYLGIPSMNQWITSPVTGVTGAANYGDICLTDKSILDFYKNLLDGDNKREWQRWKAANFAFSQTFFDNRLGFEFVYDRQRYQDGQFNLLGAPEYTISIDINKTLIDGSSNPNCGKPFVAASGQNGGTQTFIDRDSFRFTTFAELRASDLMGQNTLSKIIGRHLFTGVASQDGKVQDNRSFLRFATDQSFSLATGQGPMGLNNAARYIDWVAYLGNTDFRTKDSAAGANLSRITGTINPTGSLNVRYFSPVWNATGVDPTAPYTYTSYDANAQPVTNVTTQVNNPANYVGWTTKIVDVMNATEDDLEDLYTAGTKNDNRIRSYGITWQGYFCDDSLVTTLGWRQDSVRHKAASAKLVNGTAVMDYAYDDNDTRTTVGHSLSWGGVWHLKPLDKILPAGTKLSLVYNQAENFKADAPRGDVFGNAIANPEAKTKEYGLALSTLHDNLTLRLTHFETKQKNATLTGATGGGFGGNFYLFWACPYWSATEALAALEGLQASGTYDVPGIPAEYVKNNWYSWQTIAVDANGNPDGARIFQIVSDFFQNFPLSQYTCDQYGLQLDVAKMHSKNPADWFAAVGADTPTDQALGAQPLYAGVLKSFGTGPTATNDTVSKGWELEATAKITKNWDLTLNASKTSAVRSNLSPSIIEAMKTMTDFFNTDAGLIKWWGGPTFQAQWNNGLVAAYNALLAQEGSQAAEVPEWRANVITTYRFDNGRLKGAYVGGAYRWEDRRILGYRLLKDSNGKDTASINVNDPMYGPTSSHFDMWVGYSRDITAKVNWRIQLNVRNILEADKLVPVSKNPDGVLALARIQEGMSWQISNTFSF